MKAQYVSLLILISSVISFAQPSINWEVSTDPTAKVSVSSVVTDNSGNIYVNATRDVNSNEPITLIECFEEFTRPEHLIGDNKWKDVESFFR